MPPERATRSAEAHTTVVLGDVVGSRAIADRLGVSQQAVSKTLRGAGYDRVRRAETRLNRALARALENGETGAAADGP